MPNVSCPSCSLSSYAVMPHSAASPCPYCDAELFPRIARKGARVEDPAGAGAGAGAVLPAEGAGTGAAAEAA